MTELGRPESYSSRSVTCLWVGIVDGQFRVMHHRRTTRRDARAARRFFRRLLNSQRQEPVRLVTDTLGSYRVAHRDVRPLVTHDTTRYANNRAEVSHQPTRQRERQMRGFTSSAHAQCFLHVHGIIHNLFRVGRHRPEIGSSSNVAGTSVHRVDRGDGSLISD